MKFNIFLSIIILGLLAISCEKILDLDLNEANPKPVFEAILENDSTCHVKASWTSSYLDNTASPVIPDATINIAVAGGGNEELIYKGNGIYKGSTILGTIGNTYDLTINLDGNTYTSTSTMPSLTPIDSLTTQFSSFGPNSGYLVYINYKDSANLRNYYAKQATYFDDEDEMDYVTIYGIRSDNLSDGIATRTIAGFQLFEPGDTVSVELASIDRATHLYFKTLEDAISGAGFASAAPANPTTNIEGGALGYFSAWSKDTAMIVIP